MPLIAPRIQGPVNELSVEVEVVGVLAGANVMLLLFDDDTPGSYNILLTQATAKGASISFAVQPGQLTAGKYLSALQSTVADGPSESSRVREKIAAVPSPDQGLPPVVFLSKAYTCVDWILIGGLIPGSTVEISYQGAIVSSKIAKRPTESLFIPLAQPLAAGTSFVGVQRINTSQGIIQSDPVTSLPLEERFIEHNRKLDAPLIDAPIECDTAVLVSKISEGASVFVKVETSDYKYSFYGSSFWALTPQPIPYPGIVTVQQGVGSCGESTMSDITSANVLKGNLPAPVPIGPVCGNASTLRVIDLRPGATVYILYGTVYNDGREIWPFEPVLAGAWSTDCEFFLPTGWWNQAPPDGSNVLKVYQRSCNNTSPESRINIRDLPTPPSPPVISPVLECARKVTLTNVLPGSSITLWSDIGGKTPISLPQRISDVSGTMDTYRPLYYKENIYAVQDGCGNSRLESLPVMVGKITVLPAPEMRTPIRLPHGGIYLKNIVPGARVHVYVNDRHMLSQDVYESSSFVVVPGLRLGDRLKTKQTICTGQSPFSESGHAVVVAGEMKIKQKPSPVEKNNPTAITIEAFDADNDVKVLGDVWIGSSLAGQTHIPFTHTFGNGQPPPPSKVTAFNYAEYPITWNLTEPPATTAKLILRINNPYAATYPITRINWAIRRPDISNPVNSPVVVLLNGDNAQTILNKPDALNPSMYIIECQVTVQVSSNVSYIFPIRSASNFGGRNDWHQLSWNGNDTIAIFRLVIEPVYYNMTIIDITGSVQPELIRNL